MSNFNTDYFDRTKGLSFPAGAASRTTFKLGAETEETIRELSTRLGVSEREVLDFYTSAFVQQMAGAAFVKEAKRVAAAIPEGRESRKTRVLGDATLKALEEIAAELGVKRDLAVETVARFARAAFCEEKAKDLETVLQARKEAKLAMDDFNRRMRAVHEMLSPFGSYFGYDVWDLFQEEEPDGMDQLVERLREESMLWELPPDLPADLLPPDLFPDNPVSPNGEEEDAR